MIRFRRRRRAAPALTFPLVVAVIFALAAWQFERSIEPTLIAMAETKATVVATDLINQVITQCIVDEVKTEQLVSIEKNQAGDIALIRINTMAINWIETTVLQSVQAAIKGLSDEVLEIPLGQVLGSRVFAASGPRIKVRILPMGRVFTQVSDRFESAGINQVKHCTYLNAEVHLRIMAPLSSSTVVVKTTNPLTALILPGKVPVTHVQIQ
ncbi:MAG: sporulation protein YunB [Firmicutes bacterium]|nr:sporulation protein YunB [Bacillota bacterium]